MTTGPGPCLVCQRQSSMKIHDTLLGLIFVAIGISVLVTASGYPQMPGQDVGPAMFPSLVAVGMVVFGGILAFRSRRIAGPRQIFAVGDWIQSPRHIIAGLSVVLGCIAYATLSNVLGFLILTPLLLLVWHVSFGVRVPTAIASAVITTLVFWAVFYKGLGVPLPWGLLKAYAF